MVTNDEILQISASKCASINETETGFNQMGQVLEIDTRKNTIL